VARHVANKNVQPIIAGFYEAIVTADRPNWLIVGFYGNSSPGKALGCKALLNTLGELKLLLHLALAL
jgi:hypothetical protein